jgi:hypothetical protein
MKKSILLLTFILLLAGKTFSQTFHAFLFCKTSDPDIGTSVKINYANMQDALQVIANGLNYTYKEHSLTSINFNIKNVLKYVDSSNIQPVDIVFMYFSTHGAKSKWDSNIFPQIDIPDTLLSVYKLYKKMLSEKNPKSIITLVEACSGFQKITPQQAFIYQTINDSSAVNINTSLQKQNIQKLFSSNCDIIVTAGQPGKNTWATSEGSMFTNCFLRTLNEFFETTNITMVNWENLLQQCKQYTYDMTSSTSITYYPVWEKTNCNELLAINALDIGLTMRSIATIPISDITTSPISNIATLPISNIETIPISNIETLPILNIDTLPILNKVSLNISNSKAQKRKNHNSINLSISGNSSEINSISKVQYFLDITMPKPIVTNTNQSKNFSYEFSVWREFPIKAKVFYKNGKVVDLYGEINFKKSN